MHGSLVLTLIDSAGGCAVHTKLPAGVGYTTLETKGYLKKKAAEGRAYRYQPAVPEQRVVKAMVRDFVDRVFDGASTSLVAHLVAERPLSEAERDELRRLIDEAES